MARVMGAGLVLVGFSFLDILLLLLDGWMDGWMMGSLDTTPHHQIDAKDLDFFGSHLASTSAVGT